MTDSPIRHSALPLHNSLVDLKIPKCDCVMIQCLKIVWLVQTIVDIIDRITGRRKGKLTPRPTLWLQETCIAYLVRNVGMIGSPWTGLHASDGNDYRPVLPVGYKQTHLRACHTMSTWWCGSLPRRTMLPPPPHQPTTDSRIYIIQSLPFQRHR